MFFILMRVYYRIGEDLELLSSLSAGFLDVIMHYPKKTAIIFLELNLSFNNAQNTRI